MQNLSQIFPKTKAHASERENQANHANSSRRKPVLRPQHGKTSFKLFARVKAAMTELKTSLTSPRSQKRGYYQTVECNDPHYENKVKHQKLSSNLNFAYFDKQYGEVLEVGKNREVRRGLKERFLELHEKAQKWELLAYHLKVICAENPEVEPLPNLENDA